MSDSIVSRFIKGTVSVGIGNVSVLVLGLAGTMIVARYMPEEEYGVFVLFQVVAFFLMVISSFGMDLALARFVTRVEDDREQARKLVNTAIWFRIIVILITSVVTFIAQPLLYALFGESLAQVIVFVPVLFFLDSLTNLLKAALQGFFLFRQIGIADFVASLSNFLLILGFVLALDYGLLGLVYARLISGVLAGAYAFLATPIEKRLEFERAVLKELLVFGYPLQINDILSFVFRRIDTLVVGALLGPAQIAQYEIARRIPDSLRRLYEAFSSVFFPFISRFLSQGEEKKAARLINNSMRLASVAGVLGTLLVLLFGNELIGFLFSERYLPSVPAFVVLMFALSVSLVSNLLGTSLVAAGDTNKPPLINTVHSTVSLVGSLLLIPPMGILGAAFASLSGNLASNPLNLFFVRRKKVAARPMYYLKPFLVFGAVIVVFFLLQPITLLGKVALLALFVVLSALFAVVTSQDLTLMVAEARAILPEPLRHLLSRSPRT